VDFAPGAAFPRHSHPGEEIVYAIEGPAGAVHAVRNIGQGNAAELATYIVYKGKPLLVLGK
jgi:quercetin dioxygenase-like cupin family protein